MTAEIAEKEERSGAPLVVSSEPAQIAADLLLQQFRSRFSSDTALTASLSVLKTLVLAPGGLFILKRMFTAVGMTELDAEAAFAKGVQAVKSVCSHFHQPSDDEAALGELAAFLRDKTEVEHPHDTLAYWRVAGKAAYPTLFLVACSVLGAFA